MTYRDEEHKLQKHSVVIAGHSTSITLENLFWQELKKVAKMQCKSLGQLITQIDAQRRDANLSSAVRIFVLKEALK